MLWQSCLIAVAVIVGLSCLALLFWKYASDCSGSYQPRALTLSVEADMIASEIADALRSVAGALCMCAVSGIARGMDDQIELAAEALKHCEEGFARIEISEAASERIIEAITGKKAKKK